MCFFDSGGDRYSAQARPVELRPRVTGGIQYVNTLEELRYVAYPAGTSDISAIPGGAGQAIDFYTIYHVNAGPEGAHIALLGAQEETGKLYE